MDLAARAFPDFLSATKDTIIYCVVSFALALILGLILSLTSSSRYVWLRAPTRIYIEIFRSTPILTQIFILYYGVGALLVGPNLAYLDNAWVAGIACLSLNYAAYEAEVFRAGFLSVEHGQTEAALSLGLTSRESFL